MSKIFGLDSKYKLFSVSILTENMNIQHIISANSDLIQYVVKKFMENQKFMEQLS